MLEGKTPAYTVKNSTDPAAWGAKIPDLGDSYWYVSCKWDANGYRLPAEPEWQWAAMGGDAKLPGKTNTTGYTYPFAGSGKHTLDQTAWYKDNSGGAIHPVGGKSPNERGLYDMSGNVMEWCWEWLNTNNYEGNYGAGGIQDNVHGWDNNTDKKMRRGGSYLSETSSLFLNYRGTAKHPDGDPQQPVRDPRNSDPYAGFRIVYRD
jgi:formylglycine-generating enzyme required for sulfatase activity